MRAPSGAPGPSTRQPGPARCGHRRGRALISAVRTVAAGRAHFSRTAVARILQGRQDGSRPAVSAVEIEVSRRSPTGIPSRRSAAGLHLSQHTVRNHIRSAMGRLGVHTSLEAVITAASAGLVSIRPED